MSNNYYSHPDYNNHEQIEQLPREHVEKDRYAIQEDRRQKVRLVPFQSKRLMRNRVAAKECRKKKKVYVEHVEFKAKSLAEQNEALIRENTELKERLVLCRCELGSSKH